MAIDATSVAIILLLAGFLHFIMKSMKNFRSDNVNTATLSLVLAAILFFAAVVLAMFYVF